MALWMVRAGRHGEHEPRFFGDNKVYLTWKELGEDLHDLNDRAAIRKRLAEHFPAATPAKLSNNTGQIAAFLLEMKPDDLVVIPRKGKSAMAIGKTAGPYVYGGTAEIPYRHSRDVQWLNLDVPRSAFDKDLLFSFGAIMTICAIRRHDAEKRLRAMLAGGFKPSNTATASQAAAEDEAAQTLDLERLSKDQIATLIGRKFRGHEMARLVDAVLKAQGYTTFVSPPGPDKGVDILAAPGPLGFGKPRICIQVKSQDSPVDSPTLNQLIGSMFDAMLLDVDNGPAAFTASDDDGPYDDRGLAAARAALTIAGVLAVGSARVDRRFEKHLRLRRSRTGLAERRPCWPVLKPDTTDE